MDIFSYIGRDAIALGTCLALISLMLVTVSILFMLFGVYHYRLRHGGIKVYKLNDENAC